MQGSARASARARARARAHLAGTLPASAAIGYKKCRGLGCGRWQRVCRPGDSAHWSDSRASAVGVGVLWSSRAVGAAAGTRRCQLSGSGLWVQIFVAAASGGMRRCVANLAQAPGRGPGSELGVVRGEAGACAESPPAQRSWRPPSPRRSLVCGSSPRCRRHGRGPCLRMELGMHQSQALRSGRLCGDAGFVLDPACEVGA